MALNKQTATQFFIISLLDWEFRKSGVWQLKRLCQYTVLSVTFMNFNEFYSTELLLGFAKYHVCFLELLGQMQF